MRQCCNSCGRNVHFSRTWCVRQQDPVQAALRSVGEKNRQRFRVKKAFCLLCKSSFVPFSINVCSYRYPVSQQQDPLQEALRFVCGNNGQRFRVTEAFCLLCKSSFVLFPQTYAARYPVSQCGSVVTVAGEMCMFPACVRRQDPVQEALRSVCGKTRQRFRVKKAKLFLL